MKKYIIMLIIGLCQYTTYAQNLVCGCAKSTDAQISQIEAMMATIKQQLALTNSSSITYIPIKAHFVRKTDQSGALDLGDFNDALAITNAYFLNAKIQFYLCGVGIDYIDDDKFYNFNNRSPADYLNNEIILSNRANYSFSAINMYFVNYFLSDGSYDVNSGMGGYTYTPASSITGNIYRNSYNKNIIVLRNSFVARKDNYRVKVMVHELAHYFGLYHTFQNNNNTNIASRELVTRGVGANCDSKGDWLCDTPADPFGLVGSDNNNCTYSGIVKDANGALYQPDMNNVMSYYLCPSQIQTITNGQFDKIKAGLVLRTTPLPLGDVDRYTLDCPPTIVAAPTNCLVLKLSSFPVVSWTDNSNNETGFIIERSSSPTDGFVAIAGVGPSNGTGSSVSFTDTSFPLGTTNTCYYRVKPSNTTTAYGNVVGLQVNNKCGGTWTLGDIPYQAALVIYNANSIVANGKSLPISTLFVGSSSINLNPGFCTTTGNTTEMFTGICLASPSPGRQGVEEKTTEPIFLLEAYPNPTIDKVTISYNITEAEVGSEVKLLLTTLAGKTVDVLVENSHHETGTFSIKYSTKNLPEGLYIYGLVVNGEFRSKRLMVAK